MQFVKIESLEDRRLLSAVFNMGPTALPGDVMSLQGDGFGANPQVLLSSPTTASTALPILTKGDSGISFRIPANTPINVYAINVFDGSSNSNTVYLNRATGTNFDTPEVPAGGDFRIFGRNLLLPGATPTVRFVNPGNNQSFSATVNVGASDAYTLVAKAPANLPAGVTYDVYVSNGYGGVTGETKVAQQMAGTGAGVDPFSLKVGWAQDFKFSSNVYNVKTDPRLGVHAVGDGVNNDRSAIAAAIIAAANYVDPVTQVKGGVVYLPAGTYRCSSNATTAIAMASNVVVMGDGMNSTIVQFGIGTTQSNAYGITWVAGVDHAGITGLTMTNVNSTGSWKNTMTTFGNDHSELFMNNVRFNMDGGDWMNFNGDRLLVQGCEFNQQTISPPLYNGVMTFGDATNVALRNTHITMAAGVAIDSLDGSNIVIEGNTFTRDLSYQPPESIRHGVSLTWDTNVSVLNNTFDTIGGSNYLYNNDGESILSEGGGGNRRDESFGTATGASSNTLVDSSKNFSGAFSGKPVVTIVDGTGMGQWRYITGSSGGTLTVDHPWDVIPTAGSHYSTFDWTAQQWILQGNTFTNQARGIWFYNGSTRDVAIVDNTFTNSDGVYLRPNQSLTGGQKDFNVIYNTQVIGNTLVNTSGARPAYIANLGIQVKEAETFGTASIGVEIRDNSITAHIPNTFNQDQQELGTEGYINYLRQQAPPTFVDNFTPFVLGTIFQRNTAINTNSAYSLSSGSYNTVIYDAKYTNVGTNVLDDTIPGSNHKSVRTIIGSNPANIAPTVGTAAKANPNPTTNGTTGLTVLGADDNGEPNLLYTWTVTGNPPGTVNFSDNGTNAAKNVTATFSALGSYSLLVTIKDLGGLSTTSSVTVVNSPPNGSPTVATAAKANPNPTVDKTTALTVLGADDGGEPSLTYTWSVTNNPPGQVDFSANGTNAAKNVTATFSVVGTYSLLVTIKDGGGLTTTSAVNVVVNDGGGNPQTGRSIGLDFASQEIPPGNGIASSHIAGVISQDHWNALRNASGTEPGSGVANVLDSEGDQTTLGVTWTGQGTWRVKNTETPAAGDEEMAMGAVYEQAGPNSTQGQIPVTITNVPYAKYDVYVYVPGDNNSNFIDITVNGQTLYGVWQNAVPNIDGDAGTDFPWSAITGTNVSTTAANGRNSGNYAVFKGITGSQLDILVKGGADPPVFAGPYNTTLSGIQIVDASDSSGNTGSISGNVFNDKNSNSVKDAGDNNLSGWTIYLDANNNNNKEVGEVSTTTDASGNYTFSGLADGTYHVKQVFQSGYRKTTPTQGIQGYDVSIAGGNAATGKNFSETTNVLLGGVVFNDANSNGIKDAGEGVLAGATINIVSNGSTVASRTSGADGRWKVQGLAFGAGEANVSLAGYTATSPVGGKYTGSMSSGEANQNLNFGLHLGGPAPAPSLFSANSILQGADHDSLIEGLLA